MTHVECPFCDRPTAVDPADDELVCEACGVRAAFAPDPVEVRELAAAA